MSKKISKIVPSKNLHIEDPWGEYCIKIDEDLDIESYIETIIDNTIPYIECHRKCFAQSKCPYATDEAKCKVQVLALKYFFKYAGTEVDLSDRDILLKFTRSAIFYSKFVFDGFSFAYGAIEEWVWKLMKKLYLRYPYNMSSSLIEGGNKFIDLISELIPDAYMQTVLLVEGDCEEIIFKKLFMKPDYLHPRFDRIKNMKGEGNFRRIELLLLELRRQHLKIHILADGDGQMGNTVRILEKKLLIKKHEYTLFSKSLEDAFPQEMVLHIFKKVMDKQYELYIINAVKNSWTKKGQSFCRALKKLLVTSGICMKKADSLITKAKKLAAYEFALALDKKIFESPYRNPNRSDHEILKVVHRLYIY